MIGILLLLAALINSECQECTETEKMYVGSVVINRMQSGLFPSSMEGVVFQPGQFDGICSNLFYPSPLSIGAAAKIIMHGSIVDKNILYFYSRKKSKETKWHNKLVPVIKSDHHNFCKIKKQ